MKKIPIIIDCDPGVDDSYAIALANANPNLEIVAITAVEGNVPAELTRYNALCLREIFDIDARIAYGATEPLVKPYFGEPGDVHGKGGIGGITLKEPTKLPDAKPAWDVIYEEALKHQGELILFAVGPLTNIAITLRKYPDLPKYLKRFVIMGGGTFGNIAASDKKAEFNMWVDPTAAKEVFEKMEVYMIGLDVTHASYLEEDDFKEMLDITSNSHNKQTDFLYKLTKFSKTNSFENGNDNNIIHDALAIASLEEYEVIQFEKYYIYVEDGNVINAGQTIIDVNNESGKEPNCYFAVNVDRNKFAQVIKNMCSYYSNLS